MIDKLRKLGLDSYEAKAYEALLKTGVSTSTIISRESRVPYGKIYPVLYSLVGKGYVTLYEGKPKRFMAVEPRVIISSELDKKAKELSGLKRDMTSLINVIEKTQKPAAAIEQIQVIRGRQNYLNLSVKLHKKAKSEYRSISRLPVYKPHLAAYREAVGRGVRAYALTPVKNKRLIELWKDSGVKLRYVEKIDLRYTVVDKSDVVIRVGESDETGYLVVWIQHPALAHIMAENFDKTWAQSKII